MRLVVPLLVALVVSHGARAGERDLTILLGGDVALPTGPNDEALDALGPRVFEHVAPFIQAADVAFANLEAPLTRAAPTLKKAFPMTMPPERLAWLVAAGFDVLSLANNHMGDAGRVGVSDTIAALRDAQPLLWTGAAVDPRAADDGVVFVPSGKSLRVGVLAFGNGQAAEVAHFSDRRAVLARVRALRPDCDILLVSVHGGKEYSHAAEPELTSLYRAIVDAGADLVVAHHPHVVRGIERHGRGLVLHGVGNLAFGTITERHRARGATLWGMLPIVHIVDGVVDHLRIIPLWVDNGYPLELPGHAPSPAAALQPRPLTGPYATAMLDALATLTRATDPRLVLTRDGDAALVRFAAE